MQSCKQFKSDSERIIETDFKNQSYSDSLKQACTLLPLFETCINEFVDFMALLTVENYEHFNKTGFNPLLKALKYVCESDGEHVQGFWNLKYSYLFYIL